jgi:hypothetical protein
VKLEVETVDLDILRLKKADQLVDWHHRSEKRKKKRISISLVEYWEHFETTEISTNLLTNRKYFNTFHNYGTLFPFLLTNLHYFFRTLKLQKTSFDLCVTRLSQLYLLFKLLVIPLAQLIGLSTHKRMNFFEVFY